MDKARRIFILTWILLSWPLAGSPVEAGWLDWMWGTDPTVAYYPTTGVGNGYVNQPVYPPANFNGGAYYPPAPIRRPLLQGNMQGVGIPGTVAPGGCNTCQPQGVTMPQATVPCNRCQPTVSPSTSTPYASGRQVVNYAPQVNYRTTWSQVPVTNFRPVTMLDPVTGASVTAMQPCATSQYQVRRVATPGSLLSALFPWCNRRQATVPVTANCLSGCTPNTVAPGCSSCGGGTTVTNPSSGIYYGQPATSGGSGTGSIPATSAPGSVPATQQGGSQPVPGTRGGTPADQRPNLNPNNNSMYDRSELNRPTNNLADTNRQNRNRQDSGGSSVDRTPFHLHHTPPNDSTTSTNRSSLQPIPDPDAPSGKSNRINAETNGDRPNAPERPGVPQLLNPRDRSASVPDQPWGIIRATWPVQPENTVSQEREASYETPSRTRAAAPPLDTSGWRKAR